MYTLHRIIMPGKDVSVEDEAEEAGESAGRETPTGLARVRVENTNWSAENGAV